MSLLSCTPQATGPGRWRCVSCGRVGRHPLGLSLESIPLPPCRTNGREMVLQALLRPERIGSGEELGGEGSGAEQSAEPLELGPLHWPCRYRGVQQGAVLCQLCGSRGKLLTTYLCSRHQLCTLKPWQSPRKDFPQAVCGDCPDRKAPGAQESAETTTGEARRAL